MTNESTNGIPLDSSLPDEEPSYVNDQEAQEEIDLDDDHHMDEDDDDEQDDGEHQGTSYRGNGAGERIEIDLVNDSSQHFDLHTDSIFAIARHPKVDGIVATGGGDDVAYIWTTKSGQPSIQNAERSSQDSIFKVEGHTDSISSLTFTTNGEYLVTGGMDGRITVVQCTSSDGRTWKTLTSVQEVEEVTWVKAHPTNGNMFAIGASDGSVWVYNIDPSLSGGEVTFTQAFYNHIVSCTAGAFAPDGKLLATVAEDSTFFVHDVESGAVITSFGQEDLRFVVDGGLNAITINSNGTIVVVGGATGECRVIGLPGTSTANRRAGVPQQSGSLLATLATQSDSVESLKFHPSLPLLAAGSVDGTVVLYETQRWGVRHTIRGHEDAVVKVEFGTGQGGWELTTCSMDGTVRKWDCRTGEAKGSWRGHTEGVMDFVLLGNGQVVTAGDDGVSLVFEMTEAPSGIASSTGAP